MIVSIFQFFFFVVVFTAMIANSLSWQETLKGQGRAGGVAGLCQGGACLGRRYIPMHVDRAFQNQSGDNFIFLAP